jgi:hypothetical protein
MIPSGYKEDVVYSEIPINGAGDLSFTRASNGTRINSQGLVEVCPWNMLSNSEQFTSSNGWFASITGGSTATQTSDYGVAPNGTTTADRIQLALNGQPYADWVSFPTLPIVVGQVYTYSIYMKSLSGTPTIYFFYDGVSSINKTLTTDWVRYEHTFTATNTSIYPRFLLQAGSSSSADLLAWGYQLNIGATAKPYFPTTDRLNVPRLTYQNGGGGCPSLLLEKQSTNVCTYSQDFSQTVWGKPQTTITTNATTSPDGTQNADRMFETAVTDNHGVYQNMPLSTGTNYAVSCYVKKGNRSYCGLQFYYNLTNGAIAFFNLDNGTLVYEYATSSGGAFSVTNSKIEDVGNGWYKLSGVFQVGITDAYPGLVMASTQWSTGTSYNNQYLGDTSKYIDIYGFQIEQSSYPTSYIPTTSSSATRVADACQLSMGTLLAQSNWTIFFDHKIVGGEGGSAPMYSLYESSADNVFLYVNGNAGLNLYMPLQGGYVFGTGNNDGFVPNQRSKVLLKYNGTTIKYFINGVLYGSASASLTYTQRALFYETSKSFQVNETVFFPIALTDAECIAITTI